MEGPRRYGKTSLLKAALDAADKDGFVPIYVNFLGVLTAGDVAERIERAYREQLEGALRRWFAGVVSTLSPRAKAAPAPRPPRPPPRGGRPPPTRLNERAVTSRRRSTAGAPR